VGGHELTAFQRHVRQKALVPFDEFTGGKLRPANRIGLFFLPDSFHDIPLLPATHFIRRGIHLSNFQADRSWPNPLHAMNIRGVEVKDRLKTMPL
jgi:hypothetical protein